MAIVVAWFATRKADPRVVAWNTAWSAAAILSIFDTTDALLSHQVGGRWFAENVVSNILGGALIAVLLIGIFDAADFAQKHLPVGATTRRNLAKVVIALGGLLYCCIAYYVSGLFYAPLPARFDISVSAPASGATAPKETTNSSGADQVNKAFSFAPEGRNRSNVRWISPPGKVAVRANFDGSQLPRVEVRLVAGCTSAEQVQKLETETGSWMAASDVSSFEVVGDAGPTDFMTVLPSTQTSTVKLHTGPVTMFNIAEEPNSKSFSVTQFVDEAASLEVRSGNTMKFLLGIPLMSANDKKVTLAPRQLTVRIDGQTQLIRFWPPKSIRDVPERMECEFLRDLKPLQNALDGDADVHRREVVLGVLMTISQPVDTRSMSTEDVGIQVKSSGGWITLVGLQPENLRHEWLGRLRMLQVRGNVSDLSLDDVSQAPRQVETYTVEGDLQAQFVEGKLRIWGHAKRLWKDEGRLNATKWEQLSWEPKLFVVSLLLSTIGLLGAAIARRLRTNEKFSWMN